MDGLDSDPCRNLHNRVFAAPIELKGHQKGGPYLRLHQQAETAKAGLREWFCKADRLVLYHDPDTSPEVQENSLVDLHDELVQLLNKLDTAEEEMKKLDEDAKWWKLWNYHGNPFKRAGHASYQRAVYATGKGD